MEILLDRDGVWLYMDGVCWRLVLKENEKFIGNCVHGLQRKNKSFYSRYWSVYSSFIGFINEGFFLKKLLKFVEL